MSGVIKEEGEIVLRKNLIILLGLLCMIVVKPIFAAPEDSLPALGDSRSGVELQFGPPYVVQEDTTRFWTDSQWAMQNKSLAKAYGYFFSAHGINATLWIAYDRQNQVEKETLILDGNTKIRDFGLHFPAIHAAIIEKGGTTAVIRNYPKDQLAARINMSNGVERWVRFFFTDDDKTCVNMHSKITGFEIAEISKGEITEKMKPGKIAGCQFNGTVAKFSADATWNRVDNCFLPQLFFSERLIPRQGTDTIVIHHAAMPVETSRADIHELHLLNGWAGTGYHKLVFAGGTIENGRPEQMVGAHAAGANRRSLGIVLVGDFNKERPGQSHLVTAAGLTADLMKKYRISLENVRPHRVVNQDTDCPGYLFPWQEFLRLVESGLK